MQKILRKRIFRDLKENLLRYLGLFFLIILCMFIVIGLVGSAETVIQGVNDHSERNKVEDGQFSVFVPLDTETEKKIKSQGVTLEKMFYLDYELDDSSTLRIFKNRNKINLIELDEGKLASSKKEIVLEKRYAQEHNLSISNEVRIGNYSYTITGIGSTPDYDCPYKSISDSSVDSDSFGIGFMTEDGYKELQDADISSKTQEYVYAYRLNGEISDDELKQTVKDMKFSADQIKDKYFQDYWKEHFGNKDEMKEQIQKLVDSSKVISDILPESAEFNYEVLELQDTTNEILDKLFKTDIYNLTEFIKMNENPRIRASVNDRVVNKFCGLVAGVIVMILFTYVISVFIIHGIEKDISIIGTLYALGVKKKDLMIHYLILPIIVVGVAGIIGTLLGFSPLGLGTQMKDVYGYFSVPKLKSFYPVYLMIYGLIMPPVVACLVNYMVIKKKLSRPALELIRIEQKKSNISDLNLGNMGFIRRFQIRQMLREIRTGVTVIFGIFISLLIVMLGVNSYTLCKHISSENKQDVKYEYMYSYKYPEVNVPVGGEACYAKTLKKERYGYKFDVIVFGIDDDCKYFDADVKEGKSNIILSSAVAQKYGLKVGDSMILTDEEENMDYAFRIDDITQYSVGLYVFMDIDSMRELFAKDEDYYNVVLSDKDLNIPTGRLYSVLTKSDINKSSNIFIDQIRPMFIMIITVSILILFLVMYLMIKVMIDRSEFNISLMKVFGYRIKEIRKLYLNGNFFIVAIGAAICIPISKKIMDFLYPLLMSNIGCYMNLSISWQIYTIIYMCILIIYFVINQLLVLKLKKIIPAEVLKNRE